MRPGQLEQGLQKLWYGQTRAWLFLLPLSWLYCALAGLRRLAYRYELLSSTQLDCHVLVVGNITAGGTGKTPLVIAIARRAQQAGLRVGILTRGYRGRARHWPRQVHGDSDPAEVGEEAVLLARKTAAPVFAGPDRAAAGRALLQVSPCDLLISDDGLQHYALHRDTEIALVDATRGQGNGFCLPAGPLREPASRLRHVDAVVLLGEAPGRPCSASLRPEAARAVADPSQRRELEGFRGQAVHAVAGIGNPERFFSSLRAAGLEVLPHPFPDHHLFSPTDLAFADDRPVLMTEKDALKCEGFAAPDWWYVPVAAQPDAALEDWLAKLLHQDTRLG
ncbi:MAG TPA: tetraacyldisaccharide 4'-kinase [Gammaproteobacteria bacterium]|nr:tetraacyldisaccharide 4'-kinase [Gammaproteobacteria bacterium]